MRGRSFGFCPVFVYNVASKIFCMTLPAYNRGLHRFAVFTACCTLLLLVAGALVTSHDAGLAVPDWPLSYGSLMPPMVGGIFWEHGHRMVATTVGFLTIILAIWIQRRDARAWMRWLGWAALAAVIAQGILGGLTVKFLLPKPVSISHASLAQLFFCATVAIAFFTGKWWTNQEGAASLGSSNGGMNAPLRLATATAAAVFVQLVLGAAFRHKAIGLVPHIVWAGVITALIIGTHRKIHVELTQAVPVRLANALLGMLMLQLALGVGAWWTRTLAEEAAQPMPAMVGFTVAHVAVGAATLATSLALALACARVSRSSEGHTARAVSAAIGEGAA